MEKKIVVAIPAMNTVPTQFAASLAILQKPEDTVIGFQMGSLAFTARNNLAKAAVDMGADYVFWLDSDMTFEPDTLMRLLKIAEDHPDDIISGLYFRRVAPYTPVVYDVLDIQDKDATYRIVQDIPDEMFEVAAVGFGCCLTPASALKAVMDEFGAPFNHIRGVGEDLSFCWRARQCGVKIYCDPSISCGHVGYMVFTRAFYDRQFSATKEGT